MRNAGLCHFAGAALGVAEFLRVQPVTAAIIPPLAWVTFQMTAVRQFDAAYDAPHLIAPLFTLFFVVYAPDRLDFVIPALFATYGLVMLVILSSDLSILPKVRLETGDLPWRIWRVIGFALIGSAISDGVIVAAQVAGRASWQPWIIAISSTVMLLVVGGLTLSQSLMRGHGAEDDEATDAAPERAAVDVQLDTQIMTGLDDLVTYKKLFLDPDLTLSQLSRKLGVPAKQLSGAINRSTGENVSRYINTRQIEAAGAALLAGQNITSAMLACGFNTKSNFNREFLQIKGASPSEWLATHTGGQS